ncbi:MAG: hypothetical protein HS108_12700 [Planctomycetes bacterium]|jgi:ABC-type transport system substrate-binding protein|nr:hypothetical protein [Planctomycetota bacterium]MCL4729594.1 hypothetical protein [Planctomycetota bacterium]
MKSRAALLMLAPLAALLPWALAVAQPVPPPPPEPEPPKAAPAQPQSAPSTVRFFGSDWTLDPHDARDPASLSLCCALYDTLYIYGPGPRPEIKPLLAEALPEVSEDGLAWTIRLRKGVRFHNSAAVFGTDKSRELKARDVVDSLKRLSRSGTERGMYWLIQGIIQGLDDYGRRTRDELQFGADDVTVAGVSAPDDRTVVLKLTRPFGALLTVLAHPCTSVIPREAMDALGSGLAARAVGSGPYRVHAVAGNSLLVLKRFEDYWGEKPGFERIVYSDEASGRWEQYFESGQTAVMRIYSTQLLERILPGNKPGPLLQKTGCTPVWSDETGMYFLAFNMEDPLWGALDDDGRLLRKAVSLAVQRPEYAAACGYAEPWSRQATTPMPPHTEFDDLAARHDMGGTDAKAAKAALDASKYKGGKDPATGAPLVLEVALTNATMHNALGKNLKQALQPLGITVVTRVARGDYRETVRTSKAHAFFAGWFMDSPDAQNFLQLFWGANAASRAEFTNTARYRSEEYDRLYREFEALLPSTANETRRRELADALLALLARDRPLAPLFVMRHAHLYSRQVQWPDLPVTSLHELRHLKPAKTE